MIELMHDAAAFAAAARSLLAARPDGTIIATVLHAVRGGRYEDVVPRFAVVHDTGGAVVGAALRTPPWPMLCCGDVSAQDADRLIGAWLADDPEVPGVNATVAVARAIGDAWAARTGGRHRVELATALHALEVVADPPHLTTGSLRRAGPADEQVVVEWMRAFVEEIGDPESAEHASRSAQAMLADGRAYVWEDAGEVVSMLGHTVAIDGVPRVGPVYSPPQRRGRGYAGHAVAQLSRKLLAEGAHRCVLFTDLANPTSNKIYAEVGYTRVSDWELRLFKAAGQAGAESPTTG
jgi:hypothetical protein